MTTARRRRLRSLLALVGVTPLLAGCVLLPDAIDPPAPCSAFAACTQVPTLDTTSATYAQTQALPDFDMSTYLVTDEAALADLDALLAGQVRGDVTSLGDCDGGRTTELVIESAVLGTVTVLVDTCSDDPLADEVDELIGQWRADGVASPVP